MVSVFARGRLSRNIQWSNRVIQYTSSLRSSDGGTIYDSYVARLRKLSYCCCVFVIQDLDMAAPKVTRSSIEALPSNIQFRCLMDTLNQ